MLSSGSSKKKTKKKKKKKKKSRSALQRSVMLDLMEPDGTLQPILEESPSNERDEGSSNPINPFGISVIDHT